MNISLHTDGGARGNPGPAGYGYVVTQASPSSNDSLIKEGSHQAKADLSTEAHQAKAEIILRKCGNYCGETTNNQAEYLGLIAGLSWIKDNLDKPKHLDIYMDSLLIVNQVKGIYKVKNTQLAIRHREVGQLLAYFPSWSISHTYRSGNSEADALVNQAIDLRRLVVQV